MDFGFWIDRGKQNNYQSYKKLEKLKSVPCSLFPGSSSTNLNVLQLIMLSFISLGNFKSYEQAKITLASLTFLIGANASGKSNALEGIRLLSWLAKGGRLDDIERTIQGGDSVVRGEANDLFYQRGKSFILGGCIEVTNRFHFLRHINFEIGRAHV